MPIFEPDLVRRSERSSTVAASRADVAPLLHRAGEIGPALDAQALQRAVIRVERMARQKEADGVELAPQPVGGGQGCAAHFQRRRLASRRTARSGRPPARRRVRLASASIGSIEAKATRALRLELVEGAGGGETFERLLVDRARIDARARDRQRSRNGLPPRAATIAAACASPTPLTADERVDDRRLAVRIRHARRNRRPSG